MEVRKEEVRIGNDGGVFFSKEFENFSHIFGVQPKTISDGSKWAECSWGVTDEGVQSYFNVVSISLVDGKPIYSCKEIFRINYNRTNKTIDTEAAKKFFIALKAQDDATLESMGVEGGYSTVSRTCSSAEKLLVPIANYIADTNKYAFEAFKDICGDSIPNNSTALLNGILLVEHMSEVEKTVKVSKLFKERFYNTPMDELLQITNLKAVPVTIRQWIDTALDAYSASVKSIALKCFCKVTEVENGNNAMIIVDYLKAAMKVQMGRRNWSSDRQMERFFSSLTYLVENGYSSKKVLEYIIRQSFYNGHFGFPEEEISMLKDYVSMAINNGLSYDRFPQDVFKAHNIMMSCVTSMKLTDEEIESFKNHCAAASKYAVEKGDYCVVLPTQPKDVVDEGNALSHCVGNYVREIAKGNTIIAFLRLKSAPETSLYTIEIQDNRVTEAKGEYNMDVPADVLDIIKDIEHKWKKNSAKDKKEDE